MSIYILLLQKRKTDKIQIEVLNEQIAEVGSEIIFERLKFIGKINEFSGEINSFITESREDLKIKYCGSFKTEDTPVTIPVSLSSIVLKIISSFTSALIIFI